MKKFLISLTTCAFLVVVPFINVYADTLDDIVDDSGTPAVEQPAPETTPEVTPEPAQNETEETVTNLENDGADEYIKNLQEATKLDMDNPASNKANQGIKKVAAIIINILSYALIVGLSIRIVLDLIYIALPFTRSALANGYGGNPAAGGAGMGMQQPGMGMGIGMNNGFGNSFGGGFGGGYGNRMGMGMGMNQMNQGQAGANPAMGRIQWISNAALNAVASESQPGPDGKPQSALKTYAKDMIIVLVGVPILLTLTVTGVLTNLGFLIGGLLGKLISNTSGFGF